jgi:hypothetical protein
MTEKIIDLVARKRAVVIGAVEDNDGYCGCPKCGSYEITHDGTALDLGSISCRKCGYGIRGEDQYELIGRWNTLDRSGNNI